LKEAIKELIQIQKRWNWYGIHLDRCGQSSWRCDWLGCESFFIHM